MPFALSHTAAPTCKKASKHTSSQRAVDDGDRQVVAAPSERRPRPPQLHRDGPRRRRLVRGRDGGRRAHAARRARAARCARWHDAGAHAAEQNERDRRLGRRLRQVVHDGPQPAGARGGRQGAAGRGRHVEASDGHAERHGEKPLARADGGGVESAGAPADSTPP
eukprot:6414129-Prymnesium_polylepis.1